ncbi:COG3650 family protein [Pseudotabrizicola sp. L79]|uniref:COG3650 family protein n=1 Tax=Pseudotabrizicola sp. L79 TaxID=3118402 RepID=UPI002F945AFA
MIFRALCFWLALAAPLPALAQGYPAAFQVTGVAEGDRLNIRNAPSASADIIGDIGPYGLNIEVLETSADGKWGKVGIPEGNGWVAMRYLEATPPEDPYQVPRPLSCFGTEPFWSVSLYPRGAEYNSPETGVVPMTVLEEGVSDRGYLIRLEEGPTLTRTLIVKRQRCGDGMSDREFGFTTLMFLSAPDGNDTFTGCCTLDHR